MCPARPSVPAPRHVTATIPIFTQPGYPKQPGMRSRPELPSSIALHPSSFLSLLPHLSPHPRCHHAMAHTNFPPLRRALSPAWTRPIVFQYGGSAGNGESHTDRPVPPAPSSHGTTTEALLLPHPAASPVKPPRQRARPTWLPLFHSPFAALSPSPRPWSPNPLLARPDTVTVTGLRRTTSRGSIR